MAKTLKEFLEDRAQWDHQALNCATTSLPSQESWWRNMGNIRRGDHGILMPYKYVHEASLAAICQLGEAIDRMRENAPDDYKQLSPEFPWAALISYRHALTHYGKLNESVFRPQAERTMRKNMDAAYDTICKHWPPPLNERLLESSELYRQAIVAARMSQIFTLIAQGFEHGENIPVTDSARVERIMEDEGFTGEATSLAMLILYESTRYRANMAMDALDKTSSLLRASEPDLFGGPMHATVRFTRNHMAHFNDRLKDDGKITVADIDYQAACLIGIDAIRTQLKQKSYPQANDAVAFQQKLVGQYANQILGRAVHDPAKCAELDNFTQWIAKNFTGKLRLQEAAIYAAGQTIQLPLEQAKQILDYIKKNKTALVEPEKMRAGVPDDSNVLRIGVRDYIDNLQTLLHIDQQKSTIISISRR